MEKVIEQLENAVYDLRKAVASVTSELEYEDDSDINQMIENADCEILSMTDSAESLSSIAQDIEESGSRAKSELDNIEEYVERIDEKRKGAFKKLAEVTAKLNALQDAYETLVKDLKNGAPVPSLLEHFCNLHKHQIFGHYKDNRADMMHLDTAVKDMIKFYGATIDTTDRIELDRVIKLIFSPML